MMPLYFPTFSSKRTLVALRTATVLTVLLSFCLTAGRAQHAQAKHPTLTTNQLQDILETSLRALMRDHHVQASNQVVWVRFDKSIALKQPKSFFARFTEAPTVQPALPDPPTDRSGWYRDKASGKALFDVSFHRVELRAGKAQVECHVTWGYPQRTTRKTDIDLFETLASDRNRDSGPGVDTISPREEVV